MKSTLALSALLLSSLVAGPSSFAAFKVCGAIRQAGPNTMVLVQYFGNTPMTSSIYGKTAKVEQQLRQLVGFREVCVAAYSSENDIVVLGVLSRSE